MRMVIGGAYQGKMEYVSMEYPDISWIDGAECGLEEVYQCEGIYHFEEYIKRMMKNCGKVSESKKAAKRLVQGLIMRNPEIVIVSREIGYGLVPVDEFERNYRETVGRICTRLASYSERVDRVVCGIGTIIKKANEKAVVQDAD